MKQLGSTKKMHGLMLFVLALAMMGMLPISATAALSPHPNTFAVVTNQFSNSASVVNLSVVPRTLTPVALTAPIKEAWNVKITPDGTKALISGIDDGIVCVFDLAQDPPQEIARVSVGGFAMQIAITPDGKRALVGNQGNNNVSVLDLMVNPPTIIRTVTIDVGYSNTKPYAVGITPDGLYAIIGAGGVENYVTVGKAYVLNLATYEVEYDITIGRFPIAMAIDPLGKAAVINTIDDKAPSGNDQVSILDLTTTPFSLKTKVVVGRNPGSEPAISWDGKYAVVANADSDNASIIDLTLDNPVVVSTLSVGDDPRGVAIIGSENTALIANRTSASITEIDLASLTILGSYFANSSPNHIAVFKKIINQKPVASAGADQIVNEGTLVSLNGLGSSDPDSDPLTYKWTQVGGPTVSLSDDTASTPSFIAPWAPPAGVTLSFQLVVRDGKLDSDPSVVNIAVKNVNQPPIADAGTDQSVKEGSLVTLNGSGSCDLEGETISYSWIQTAGTGVTLSDASVVNPTFTAPAVSLAGETLTFQLTVNDGTDSRSNSVNIFIENVNHPPIANAGPAQTVNAGSLVTLDGTASADPDNDPLTYQWNQTSGPPVTLSDASYQAPTFTAPDSATTLVFELVIHDGTESSAPASVTITVQNVNDPPACDLAQAKPGTLWPPNHKLVPVEIVGVTDPNNDNVTITITGVTQDEPVNGLGDGDTSPDAVIQGNKVLLRAERAGNGNGRVYHITFTATDGNGATGTGTVSVSVPHDKGKSAVDDGLVFDSTQP